MVSILDGHSPNSRDVVPSGDHRLTHALSRFPIPLLEQPVQLFDYLSEFGRVPSRFF